MNLLILSDLHLNPESVERNESFLSFLEQAHKSGDQIVIAGDLFDLWFGWPDLTFEYQRPILEKMRQIAFSGLRMEYVEGNRDFGIQRYRRDIFNEVWTRGFRKEWSGRQIEIHHGDLVNRRDIPYRLWRSITKNPISYFLLDHLPSGLLLRFAANLELKLRDTNLKHKSYYPDEMCKSFYSRKFHDGADLVILGHFHVEKEIQIRKDNRDVLFFNLPGWEAGLRYLVVPPGNSKPYFLEWGRQHGNLATA